MINSSPGCWVFSWKLLSNVKRTVRFLEFKHSIRSYEFKSAQAGKPFPFQHCNCTFSISWPLYIFLYWGSISPLVFLSICEFPVCAGDRTKRVQQSVLVKRKSACVCPEKEYTASNTFPTGVTLLRSHSAPLDLGGHLAHCKIEE